MRYGVRAARKRGGAIPKGCPGNGPAFLIEKKTDGHARRPIFNRCFRKGCPGNGATFRIEKGTAVFMRGSCPYGSFRLPFKYDKQEE